MSEIAERFRKVADGFTRRVEAVPDSAWENAAPPEGWAARDVVRHVVEWMPTFLPPDAGVEFPPVPLVDEDPAGAWAAVRDGLQRALDDPEVAGREFEREHVGRSTVADAVDTFMTPDVLVHTWDLARATGLDETLDPDEVRRALASYESIDEEVLVQSGQYGKRVPVPADADEQTRLIAISGRQP